MRGFLKTVACTALLAAGSAAVAQDPVTDHAVDDPAMEAAEAEARAGIDRVLAKTVNQSGEVHPAIFLKVAIPVAAGGFSVENIWVRDAVIKGSDFTASLANAPVHFEGTVGDRISFPKSQIVDWSLSDDGKLYGNYTTRVQLPQMDPQTRDAIASQLSENPMPEGW